jgi:hypothetical protein
MHEKEPYMKRKAIEAPLGQSTFLERHLLLKSNQAKH